MLSLFRIGLLFLLSLNLSPNSWSQSVADYEPSSPDIYFENTSANFQLFVTAGAGTDASPHTVFLPVGGTGTVSTGQVANNFSYYSSRNNLLTFNGSTVENSGLLSFRVNVDVDTGTGNDIIYIAAGDGTSYEVIQALTNQADSINLRLPVNISLICGLSDFDCSVFDKTVTPQTSNSIKLYFFVGTNSTTSVGSSVDPASVGSGVIYQVKFSNRVSENIMDLESLRKGDGRLTMVFTGFSMSDGLGLFAHVASCTSGVPSNSTAETLQDRGLVLGNLRELDNDTVTGEVKLTGLTNNTCYRVSLYNCDSFGFCSYGSVEKEETPEDIQALLEKQACFFFTAGFGESHYIVDYFQKWRDSFLKSFWLGRKFISLYYDIAPQYTPFILKNPWLQKVIRLVAYLLYGILHWTSTIIVLGILFLTGLSIVRFKSRAKARSE